MDFPGGFCYFVLSGISVNEGLTSVLALAQLGLTTGFPAMSS